MCQIKSDNWSKVICVATLYWGMLYQVHAVQKTFSQNYVFWKWFFVCSSDAIFTKVIGGEYFTQNNEDCK